jgi:hypothetical protein
VSRERSDTIPCRSCGKPIRFVETKTGKKRPVDADTGRSHFETCEHAEEHRAPRPAKRSAAPRPERSAPRDGSPGPGLDSESGIEIPARVRRAMADRAADLARRGPSEADVLGLLEHAWRHGYATMASKRKAATSERKPASGPPEPESRIEFD